jgi:hypothetical protein
LRPYNKFILFFFLAFFWACEKDPSLEGNPNGDNLEKIDTLSLSSSTEVFKAKDAFNEVDVPLGRLEDSRFGESLASFYAQLRLTTNAFQPGANASLDSAVLVLKVKNSFGPLSTPLDIEVFRLTETLLTSNTYTSDVVLDTDPLVLASKTALVYNDESSIRVPVTSTFANELFNLLGSTTVASNDNFLAYLKGIYVTVNDNSGGDGLINIDVTNAETALNLYFSSDNANDSIYQFKIDAQSLRVNQYVNDANSSELELLLNSTSNDEEVLLLGGLQSSKGKIQLPDLSFLEGSIINQATLTFYQADYGSSLNTDYALPEFLFLTGGKLNDSIAYFLTDYITGNPSAYGGKPELVDLNGVPTMAYSYSLPRFFQRLVNQETEISFLNIETVNVNAGNRVKLGGGSHPDFPITLEILYTKP